MQIQIKITNLQAVQRALTKSPVIVSKFINRAIKESINDVRDEALSRTPVDTGYLRGSYETQFGMLRGLVSPRAEYAYWVEVMPYRHTVGQSHYFEGGVKAATNQINKNFKEGLADALNAIAKEAR